MLTGITIPNFLAGGQVRRATDDIDVFLQLTVVPIVAKFNMTSLRVVLLTASMVNDCEAPSKCFSGACSVMRTSVRFVAESATVDDSSNMRTLSDWSDCTN